MIESINTWLEQIVSVLGKLYGVPGYALVFLTCVVAGYVVKVLPNVPNNVIPWLLVGIGPILNMMVADTRADEFPIRIWIVKNFIIGFLISGGAMWFHRKFLKPMEEKFGLFETKPAESSIQPNYQIKP
jgi:Phage holin family Hol44, in holin superfamily V